MSTAFIAFVCGAGCTSLVLLAGIQAGIRETPKPVADPCAVRHILTTIECATYPAEPIPLTAVLKRCAVCGNHISLVFSGSWTLEAFLKTESDISALERMAR